MWLSLWCHKVEVFLSSTSYLGPEWTSHSSKFNSDLRLSIGSHPQLRWYLGHCCMQVESCHRNAWNYAPLLGYNLRGMRHWNPLSRIPHNSLRSKWVWIFFQVFFLLPSLDRGFGHWFIKLPLYLQFRLTLMLRLVHKNGWRNEMQHSIPFEKVCLVVLMESNRSLHTECHSSKIRDFVSIGDPIFFSIPFLK